MAENKKVELTVADRRSVMLRSTFLQGSWNYERMQNGGWCYAIIPAIKRLYTTKEEQAAALKRHLLSALLSQFPEISLDRSSSSSSGIFSVWHSCGIHRNSATK